MPTYDRTLENVTRLPRSILESPSYRPDWRNRQVQLYLEEIRRRDLKQMPGLPRWEDDSYVPDLYEHRLGLLPAGQLDGQVLGWLDELLDLPDPEPLCALKALLIAGRRDGEIAGQLGVTPLHVSWFERAFFNVRPLLCNIYHMVAAVLYPLAPSPASDRENLEKLYFPVAMHGSREDLDALISGDIAASPLAAERLGRFACNNLVVQAFAATLIGSMRPPDSSDIDSWLKMRQRPGRRENCDGGQAQAAAEGKALMARALEAFSGDQPEGT